jgi:hypothetical protein
MAEQIYQLIPEAMRRVGAIGKDSVNKTQGFKYRGIDAVYNALNPVMSDLGLFIVPEILDHRREERETEKTYNGQTTKSILKYSILTIRYTMFAPDGSSVSCTVVGEGMDSGDKASNKAMSVALKYACFQLFMIPTEEMVDPDQESHEVTSGAREPKAPKETRQDRIGRPDTPPASVNVTKSSTVPQTGAETPVNPVLAYLAEQRDGLRVARGISKAENNAIWSKQISALTEKGIIENKALSSFTMEEAVQLVNFMYSLFDPKGTVLKVDGETA